MFILLDYILVQSPMSEKTVLLHHLSIETVVQRISWIVTYSLTMSQSLYWMVPIDVLLEIHTDSDWCVVLQSRVYLKEYLSIDIFHCSDQLLNLSKNNTFCYLFTCAINMSGPTVFFVTYGSYLSLRILNDFLLVEKGR